MQYFTMAGPTQQNSGRIMWIRFLLLAIMAGCIAVWLTLPRLGVSEKNSQLFVTGSLGLLMSIAFILNRRMRKEYPALVIVFYFLAAVNVLLLIRFAFRLI